MISVHVQEQSSRREICDLKQQLQSSKDQVADLKKNIQHRDSDLEILRSKVSPYVGDATPNHNHDTLTAS